MKNFTRRFSVRALATLAAVTVGVGVLASGAAPAQAVTGGDTAVQGQYPFYTGVPYCGGTLIAPTWVITAAHCGHLISPGNVLEVGSFDWSNRAGEERPVVRQVVFPNIPSLAPIADPDVALLRIDPVKTKPIPMADPTFIGEQVTSPGMGEGSDGKLKSTILKITGRGQGAIATATPVKAHTFNGPGDSGSSIFVPSSQGPRFVGVTSSIVSYGDPKTTGRRDTNFVDVASAPALRDWVVKTTGMSAGSIDFDVSAKSNAGVYLSTRPDGNTQKPVFYNSFVNLWERFTLVHHADYTVSLLARANNKYLTAPPTGDAVTASRDWTLEWEKFVPSYSPNGKVSLRAVSNNKYLSIGSNGELRATSGSADSSTQFDLAWDPQNVIGKDMDISARSSAGRYLSARIEQSSAPATFSTTNLDTWERFKLIHNSDNTVSLKANANNKYLTAPPGGDTVTATAGAIQAWEKFVPIYAADGRVALRAVSNNRYLTITGNGEMHATAGTPDASTQFTLG